MANQLDICNLALSKLGQSARIATLTEQSMPAYTLNALWPTTLAYVQTDAVWPWLLRTQALALSVDPAPPGWAYRYARPNDCATAWAVTDEAGLRSERRLTFWTDPAWRRGLFGALYDWEQVRGGAETEIVASVPNAWLVYTVLDDEPARFPPAFVEALASKLALDAAGPLIGQSGLNNRTAMLQEYEFYKNKAAVHDYNEADSYGEPVTPAMMARW